MIELPPPVAWCYGQTDSLPYLSSGEHRPALPDGWLCEPLVDRAALLNAIADEADDREDYSLREFAKELRAAAGEAKR